jgi:hypothetical protein
MQDFRLQYDRHLDLLRAHMESYDEGREHFAYSIAVEIRVFVHDTFDRQGRPRSTSLLTHLGLKHSLGFVDWGPPEAPPGALVMGAGLCTLRMEAGPDGGRLSYVPACADVEMNSERRHPPTSFIDWWQLPVLETPLRFTRAELVLDVANQEGAHVDAALGEKYAQLTRGPGLGWQTGDGLPPDTDIALASVRHIGQELIASLDDLEWESDRPRPRRMVCPLPFSSEEGHATGRNDPCPCGSGRKQKKCFGLRRPRNMSVVPGTGKIWVPPRRVAPEPPFSEG